MHNYHKLDRITKRRLDSLDNLKSSGGAAAVKDIVAQISPGVPQSGASVPATPNSKDASNPQMSPSAFSTNSDVVSSSGGAASIGSATGSDSSPTSFHLHMPLSQASRSLLMDASHLHDNDYWEGRSETTDDADDDSLSSGSESRESSAGSCRSMSGHCRSDSGNGRSHSGNYRGRRGGRKLPKVPPGVDPRIPPKFKNQEQYSQQLMVEIGKSSSIT